MSIKYFETIEVKLTEVEDLCCFCCETNERDIELLCFCVECKQYFCDTCLKTHEQDATNSTGNGHGNQPWYPRTLISQSAHALTIGNRSTNESKVFSISLPNLNGKQGFRLGSDEQTLWIRRMELLKGSKFEEEEKPGKNDDQERRGMTIQSGNSSGINRTNNKSIETCSVEVYDNNEKHQSISAKPSPPVTRTADTTVCTPNYEILLASIQKLKSELQHTKGLKLESIARLTNEKTYMLQELQEFLDTMQQMVHEIHTETKIKLNKVHKEFESQAKKDVKNLDKLIASLSKCQQELKSPIARINVPAAAYLTKVKTCEREKATIHHTFDDVFEKKDLMLRVIEEDVEDFIYRTNKISNHFLESSHSPDLPMSVDLKMHDDQAVCDMIGACQMDNGTVVVADYNNCKLKRLGDQFQVTSACSLLSMPWAVCPVNPSQVAVSLYLLKKVQLVDIETMSPAASFRVNETCRGLAFGSGELFVSCGGGGIGEGPGQIRVYTLTGQPIRTLVGGVSSNIAFSCPFHIAVSMDGSAIHVADRDNGLIRVDRNGERSSVCDSLQGPHLKGVCVDDDGNVYMSDTKTGTIMKVDTQGRQQLVAVGNAAMRSPQSLTLVHNNSKLLVTLSNSDTIKLFHLSRQTLTC